MVKPAKADWQAVRAAYEAGERIEDIAAHHKIGAATIRRHAKSGAWLRPGRGQKPAFSKPAPATRLAEPLSGAAIEGGVEVAIQDDESDGEETERAVPDAGDSIPHGVNLELDLDDGDIEGSEFPPQVPIEWKRERGGRRAGAGRRPSLVLNDVTLGRIKRLAAMGCTQEEAAGYLLVSIRTLEKFFAENLVAREAWEDGQQMGKISLRRIQWRHAVEHPQTAIFLGKNMLGQSDTFKNDNSDLADAIRETAGALDGKVFELLKRVTNSKFSTKPDD